MARTGEPAAIRRTSPLDGSELRLLGATLEREGRCGTGRDHLGDLIEVAGADLTLVASRGVAGALGGELGLLELGVRGHAVRAVLARELVHPVVERVKAGEGDELELVAHRGELALELRDRRVVEVLLPVERR